MSSTEPRPVHKISGSELERSDRGSVEGTKDLLNEAPQKAIAQLNEACEFYCRWYDTGYPRLKGGDVAYELYSWIRSAMETLREGRPPRGE